MSSSESPRTPEDIPSGGHSSIDPAYVTESSQSDDSIPAEGDNRPPAHPPARPPPRPPGQQAAYLDEVRAEAILHERRRPAGWHS